MTIPIPTRIDDLSDDVVRNAAREGVAISGQYRVPRPRTGLLWLSLVLILLVLVSAVFYLNGEVKGVKRSDSKQLGDTRQQLLADRSIAQKLSEQLRQNHIQPSVTISSLSPQPTLTGPAGQPGPPGPIGATGPASTISSIELRKAVLLCFQLHECAAFPTTTQVYNAVRTLCSSDGKCRGPVGADGSAGPQGPTGATGPKGSAGPTGADGPPPTETQIDDAVAKYCSDPSSPCQGYPSNIVIRIPNPSLTDPSAEITETCTPGSDHSYSC